MKSGILFAVLAVTISHAVYAAAPKEQPLTVNIKRLSLDTALKIGGAAIEQCRKAGYQVTVTVVDRGGAAQVVLRDTLAMDLSIIISQKKAYTAMVFNTPTSALHDRFPGEYNIPKIDTLLIAAGGIPVNVAGSLLGGIGVSGAPSGVIDEECAQAGLAAVKDDLEME
jgi:uncharacterized protein GlcG (DUF336 family)